MPRAKLGLVGVSEKNSKAGNLPAWKCWQMQQKREDWIYNLMKINTYKNERFGRVWQAALLVQLWRHVHSIIRCVV